MNLFTGTDLGRKEIFKSPETFYRAEPNKLSINSLGMEKKEWTGSFFLALLV